MTRVRVVIQARLNSSRLPGKMLLPMAGMPLIELVARRASRSGHEVVVATSAEQYDGLIERALAPTGIPVVRGSLDDVLGRFVVATADLDDEDIVVRLTGDNPVADAGLVDELLAAYRAAVADAAKMAVNAARQGVKLQDVLQNQDMDMNPDAFPVAAFMAPSRSAAAIRGIGAGLLLMRALSGSQGVRSWLNVTDRRPGAPLSPEEARAAWYL